MTAIEFELAIEKALRQYGCSASNPCGGTGYKDADGRWRVLFADGIACEKFATAEEAIEAAREFAEESDLERKM